VEDHTLDEAVENSLERIKNAYLNPISWEKVMERRKDAVTRQQGRIVKSQECGGFSFSTAHYPPSLQKLLLDCGGIPLAKKIKFKCSYNTRRSNENTIIKQNKKGKWIFKGSCFGCETLKDIAWGAIKSYFSNIKVLFYIYFMDILTQLFY
jgi:hypothetical protein